MAIEFTQVSLGFAEFVGQLLHETFEAVIGAHTHQAERTAQMQSALALSTEEFRVRFVTEEELKQTEIGLFAEPLIPGMRMTPLLELRIQDALDAGGTRHTGAQRPPHRDARAHQQQRVHPQ